MTRNGLPNIKYVAIYLEALHDSTNFADESQMAIVSNKFLGAFAVSVGLHKHLKYFGGPLQSQITEYAEEIQTAQQESDGAKDFWTATKDPPKV